ncbi:amidohydrolase family protein [Altererythrobacter sp. GH1-8]|uniref:amidohydrolase family protein n=1 Tax=Altererythrobacter sp. GH1-8 TaxID=3349333 RepID=UPI00374D40FC
MFTIDGVCHPYNFHPDNLVGRFGPAFADVLFGYHPNVNPPGVAMNREEWSRDWQPEEFMDVMFLESELDMACMHSLPIYDAFRDGGSAAEKGAYLKKNYPDRILWYAGVDMFEGAKAVDEAKRYLDQGADGLKFYPARYVDGRTEAWRMDDEGLVYPVLEAARNAGVTNVAIHKVLPIGPINANGMNVDDLGAAANAFPDIAFQIVHAGFMFVDETKMLLGNFPNIYATLEASALLAMLNPPMMDRIMDEFLLFGGPERIIFSSAAVNPHPQVVLEALAKYDLPETSPIRLGDDVRALFMGGNLARLHGIDTDARKAKLADDRFSQERSVNGLRPGFSSVRQPA